MKICNSKIPNPNQQRFMRGEDLLAALRDGAFDEAEVGEGVAAAGFSLLETGAGVRALALLVLHAADEESYYSAAASTALDGLLGEARASAFITRPRRTHAGSLPRPGPRLPRP